MENQYETENGNIEISYINIMGNDSTYIITGKVKYPTRNEEIIISSGNGILNVYKKFCEEIFKQFDYDIEITDFDFKGKENNIKVYIKSEVNQSKTKNINIQEYGKDINDAFKKAILSLYKTIAKKPEIYIENPFEKMNKIDISQKDEEEGRFDYAR